MFKLVFCLKITLKTENGQFLTADDQVVLQYVCTAMPFRNGTLTK